MAQVEFKITRDNGSVIIYYPPDKSGGNSK